ncbi:MAG: phage holin family protein [Acidobacteriota bacterium]|nr:phage holin family protein [Acidobacteriota bacterium]
MRTIAQLALNGIGVWLAARLVPGIEYDGGVLYLLLTGLVIGLINLTVKPIATLFSIPFIVLSLGLFFLAINGAMLILASLILEGLSVQGCMPAILGGLVLALFNWVVRAFGDS